MKLKEIQLSQVARFITFGSDRGGAYWPDVIAAVQARYGFTDVPKDLSELDPGKGVDFLHGKFESAGGPVVINLFKYYSAGILAQSSATVENTELFLIDLIEFASSEFDLQTDSRFESNFVESQIVVESKIDLDALLTVQSKIIEFINAEIASRGFVHHFLTTGFEIGYDSVAYPRPGLSAFTLQRRLNEPFDSNLYYSRAPLTTNAHLSLLANLEKLG